MEICSPLVYSDLFSQVNEVRLFRGGLVRSPLRYGVTVRISNPRDVERRNTVSRATCDAPSCLPVLRFGRFIAMQPRGPASCVTGSMKGWMGGNVGVWETFGLIPLTKGLGLAIWPCYEISIWNIWMSIFGYFWSKHKKQASTMRDFESKTTHQS
jgi:hypothetical protein